MAQTVSAATLGDTNNGTPAMARAAGCVGLGASSGTLEPAVANCLTVLNCSAVAGLATNDVMVVCNTSAALFAASAQSKSSQLPPAETALVVRLGNPDGPLTVVAVKKAASTFLFRSRTMDCPTTDSAAATSRP